MGPLMRLPCQENALVLLLWNESLGEMVHCGAMPEAIDEPCILRSDLSAAEVMDFAPQQASYLEAVDSFVDQFEMPTTLTLATGKLELTLLDASAFKPEGG